MPTDRSVEFKDEENAIFNTSVNSRNQENRAVGKSRMKTVELHEKHMNEWAQKSKTIGRLVSNRGGQDSLID
jgi:hypothetical protein